METVSLKMEEELLHDIDSSIKSHRYSTRTEFIRDAIRTKLNDLEKNKVISELKRFMGAAKVHVSDERLHEIRDEVAKKYARKFGIKLD